MTQTNDPTPPATPPLLIQPLAAGSRAGLAKSLVLAAIIFISGTTVGWGITRLFAPHPTMDNIAPGPPPEQLVDQMRRDLDLTDDQTQKLHAIYKARYDALKAIRDQLMPQFKIQYDGLAADVQKVLTPDQFNTWNERFERARKMMQPPPPPPRRGNGYDGPPNDGPPGDHGPGDPDGHGPHGGPDGDGPPPPPPPQ